MSIDNFIEPYKILSPLFAEREREREREREIWIQSTLISSLRGCESTKNRTKQENESMSEQVPDHIELYLIN